MIPFNAVNPLIMVDLRINETRQTGAVRKTKIPPYRLVGAVSNCAYAVRLETTPTGLLFGRRCFQLRRFNPPRHLPGAKGSIYF